MNARDQPAWTWTWQERLGLAHQPQVFAIDAPPASVSALAVGDGRWPLQHLKSSPGRAVVWAPDGIAAGAHLQAVGVAEAAAIAHPVTVTRESDAVILANSCMAVRLRWGEGRSDDADGIHPGPLLGLQVGDGRWRGGCLLDTRSNSCAWRGELRESGPLRAVYRFTAELYGGRTWICDITLDAGQPFARIAETSAAGSADQVVWDFHGADVPQELFVLDATAAHRVVRPHWQQDQNLVQMWAWSQCSQIREDGVGLVMADGDVIGCVVLDGGAWRGGPVHGLDCWARRVHPDVPVTRRGLPASAKVDATFPDAIASRGRAVCAAHCTIEGLLGTSQRTWALVAARRDAVVPVDAGAVDLGHFENVPRSPAAYSAGQGLLRRIWIQHGLVPLQAQMAMTLAWPDEAPSSAACCWPHPPLRDQHELRRFITGDPAAWICDFLAARVLGLWYGSGAAYSNVVVGRPIAPAMMVFEHLDAHGTCTDRLHLRARFAFLAYLNASEAFYAGDVTMRPLGDPDGSEPALQGMANQNFLTDALVIPGTFAEVFRAHPYASTWREWAQQRWSRQLDVHVYPESGLWEESHTYFHHVLATVWPWLLRRRDEGHGDGFADARLQALVGSAVLMATPRDDRLGGLRTVVPIGDHGPDPRGYRWLYHRFAEAMQAHAPVLAGHLAWLHREAGGEESAISPQPPAWRDGPIAGLGGCLRGRDHQGRDTLLIVRSGGAWAHHHHDDGAILLYAAGQSLITDCAGGEFPQTPGRKHASDGHSRWTPDGVSPLNCLWRCNRGWIQAAQVDAPFPWFLAWCPTRSVASHGLARGMRDAPMLAQTVRHQRLVVRLASDLWLVVDRTDGTSGRTRFHVGGRPLAQGQGAVMPLPSGEHLHLQPLWPAVSALIADPEIPSERPELLTSEVVFVNGSAPVAAVVIAVGRPDGVTVVTNGTSATVTVAGMPWQLSADESACQIMGPTTQDRIAWPDWPE